MTTTKAKKVKVIHRYLTAIGNYEIMDEEEYD